MIEANFSIGNNVIMSVHNCHFDIKARIQCDADENIETTDLEKVTQKTIKKRKNATKQQQEKL